jgi:serine/threonine protein kinase/TPR repeat protein
MAATKTCPSCSTPLPDEAAFCFMCGAATPTGIDMATGELRNPIGMRVSARDPARLQRALGDHYELGELIGRGGFAEVYRIQDRWLKRELALKVLRPELTFAENLLNRFRREAETVAALRHPNIVPIYDIGEADGLLYIIMPMIQGESLKALLVREGPRPAREVSRIMLEAADALGAAHEAGVIHRDIKPENIMLEGKGRRVQLMDFGIAKAIDSGEGSGLTSTGILVGTPHYMSPEQASGDPNLDHRSDQYSLAVVGYQMLTGALPFDGESTRAILFQQMVGNAKSLRDMVPDIPANIAFTIERAMSKEAQDRYADMEAFGDALRASDSLVQTEETRISTRVSAPAEAPPLPPPPATARRPRPRWLVPTAVGAGLIGVVALGFALLRPGAARVPPLATLPATVDSRVTTPGDSTAAKPDSSAALARTGAVSATPIAPTSTRPASTERPEPPRPERPASPTNCATAIRAADWSAATSLCQAEADRGSASAARQLGVMYERGNGVGQSDSAAAAWYRKAATAGDAQSAFRLGLILAGKPGGGRDEDATTFLRQAAEAGIEDAWPVLAERYEQGLGTKRDDQEAWLWYRKAAEQGNRASQYNLAVMYSRGRGVSKSEGEAASWFQKAAEQGHTAAQYELAMLYFRGKGVAKSDSLGMVWLEKAASQGYPDAQKELDKRRRP